MASLLFDRDMYQMQNRFDGVYPERMPQEQFPRPHWADHRTHGLRRPGAGQLMVTPGGAPAERDWSPLWIIAGILKLTLEEDPTDVPEIKAGLATLPTDIVENIRDWVYRLQDEKKPAKKAPTNGQERPTKAEVKEAKEKLKGPPEFPKGPKPLYEDVSPGEIFVAMRPTKQGKKGAEKKDGKEDKAKTDKISKPAPKKCK
eukprot:tig00020941_g16200.t1